MLLTPQSKIACLICLEPLSIAYTQSQFAYYFPKGEFSIQGTYCANLNYFLDESIVLNSIYVVARHVWNKLYGS